MFLTESTFWFSKNFCYFYVPYIIHFCLFFISALSENFLGLVFFVEKPKKLKEIYITQLSRYIKKKWFSGFFSFWLGFLALLRLSCCQASLSYLASLVCLSCLFFFSFLWFLSCLSLPDCLASQACPSFPASLTVWLGYLSCLSFPTLFAALLIRFLLFAF